MKTKIDDGGPASWTRETDLTLVDLSTLAVNSLGRLGIGTIGQLLDMAQVKLVGVRACGTKTRQEIALWVQKNRDAYPTSAAMQDESLRDYFAAKAMSGLLADPEERPTTAGLRVFYKATAETAYEIADAMLAERSKKGGA